MNAVKPNVIFFNKCTGSISLNSLGGLYEFIGYVFRHLFHRHFAFKLEVLIQITQEN